MWLIVPLFHIVGGAYASLNHLIFDNLMIVGTLYVAGWAWTKSLKSLNVLQNMFLAFPQCENEKAEKLEEQAKLENCLFTTRSDFSQRWKKQQAEEMP